MAYSRFLQMGEKGTLARILLSYARFKIGSEVTAAPSYSRFLQMGEKGTLARILLSYARFRIGSGVTAVPSRTAGLQPCKTAPFCLPNP
ncbi:hypothetical protein Acr_00g0032610 [Actinidia rufa]|uniref:Uncharacterized protein n=1 Tax=Actinidia rufa TaxID=165716 RepID=A0A7J0DFE9_9ERIC|nr:hypothetical protein Acr_00g0032610 [Actinidia rufa]